MLLQKNILVKKNFSNTQKPRKEVRIDSACLNPFKVCVLMSQTPESLISLDEACSIFEL